MNKKAKKTPRVKLLTRSKRSACCCEKEKPAVSAQCCAKASPLVMGCHD